MLLTAYDGAILGPIAKLLGWMMNGIYYLMDMIGIGNVGLSIIIFTFVIYLFMFPLTYKQQKFSKLSQKIAAGIIEDVSNQLKKKTQKEQINQSGTQVPTNNNQQNEK